MAAPLKPWERPGVNHQSSPSLFDNAMSSGPQMGSVGTAGLGATATSVTSPPPPPPPRPSASSSNFASRPMFGGYGGLGSMYSGGMYSPYGGIGGYGSYGYNRMGMHGNDIQGSTFARIAEENSRPAFQSIESIVYAVNSVSMMLDSSFQAVYSSFRAVIGVADNFSRLRSQMVQIFSALAVIRTLRYIVRRFLELLRLRPAGQAEQEWREAVAQAAGAAAAAGDGGPKKSAWPILMFFGIIMGGPWLIWKLISSFSDSQEEESWVKGETDHVVAQALYDFTGQSQEELSFSAGQQLNLAPKELQPQVRGWLLAGVDGRKGLVPYNYIKILGKRRGRQQSSAVAASASQPVVGSQSLNSAFSQAVSSPESLNQSTDTVGNVDQEAAVPNMDSIFAGAQANTLLPDSSCPTPPLANVTSPQSTEDLNAADILKKETGE